MAKRQSFNAAQGLFSPAPAPNPFFSPPDAQEVCTGSMHTKDAQEACTTSMHTKDAQEVRAAQEVQPPAPLDPVRDVSEPLVHTRFAQEVAAAQDVQLQPTPPSPAPAQVDEMAPTRTPVGYGNTQGRRGKRMPRINMAFSPENYAWIKRQSGPYHTMTEIVNELVDQARRNSYGN